MLPNVKNKYLIIRLSSFGDVLLTTPVISALKRNDPDCEIGFIVKKTFACMVETHPEISSIHIYENTKNFRQDIKNHSYTHLIDLQSNQRSYLLRKKLNILNVTSYKKNRLKRFFFLKFKLNIFNKECKSVPQKYLNTLEKFGINSTNTELKFNLPSKPFPFPEIESSQYICIAPGAAHKTKQWPKEYYVQLISSLSKEFKVILLGGENESTLAAEIESVTTMCQDFVGK